MLTLTNLQPCKIVVFSTSTLKDGFALAGVRVHVDKWQGETVLQSSYMSQMLNLGQITQNHNPQGNKH